MKTIYLLIATIFLTSCFNLHEPEDIEEYTLSIPAQLHGNWESGNDLRTITPSEVIDNGVALTGYSSDGRDYDSDFGYYIEFRKENYPYAIESEGVEYSYVRLVFGFAWDENMHENIYRLLDENMVEVYTGSDIKRYDKIN